MTRGNKANAGDTVLVEYKNGFYKEALVEAVAKDRRYRDDGEMYKISYRRWGFMRKVWVAEYYLRANLSLAPEPVAPR